MALLDSKQLNPKLTGSFILSGSTQTFIGRSDFQGSITASGDISASGVIIADTFQSTGGDVDGISFTDDLNLSGNLTASGDISGSGNIFGTGNLDIDGTSNLQGNVTLQNDLTLTDGSLQVTGSSFLSGSSQTLLSDQVVIGSDSGSASSHPSASLTVLMGSKSGIMLPSASFDPAGLGTNEEGMMYFNTTDGLLKLFDGSNWIPAGDINTKNTHLTMSADIDDDGSNSTILFRIDGQNDSDVKFRLKSDNVHEVTGSTNFSGSITVTSSPTSSTTIIANNMQNGYPTSNLWGSNLEGSYFNNFDNTSHVSEILRFMSGVLSHSLDVSDAAPNTKTFASVDTNTNNLGTSDTVDGYLPQSYDSTNATMLYLYTKDWVETGGQIFSGITSYHDNGSTFYLDFDSNSGGATNISSSADSELFGLGGLTSGAATEFKVRLLATQSFSDTGSVPNPSSSYTFTTQSRLDLTQSSFGSANGLTLAKINTSQPAVIPAGYQDGKFADLGGTLMTGSLTRRFSGSNPSLNNDFTSVSASGYYNFHGLTVGIATGSGNYQVVNGTTTTHFWAPIDKISSNIGTNSISILQPTQSYVSATSRSLSGVPYLTAGATYHLSASIHGLFSPMYVASTTLVDDSIGGESLSNVSIAGSGIDDVSTSGGTIQTAAAIFASESGSVRATSAVPTRGDVVVFNATYTLSGTGTNIRQAGGDFGASVSDETYTVVVRGRNRSNSRSNLATYTYFFHSGSTFGQPASSGSMAYYGRADGYDGGSLTGTSETFSGESFRITLNNDVLGFNGDSFDSGSRIGENDLQVKPGYLVNPGDSYRYWYPDSYGSGSYKYYIRRFQTSGTKTSMTVNLNNNTLVNWKASTNDKVACAILFKSSASGSGTNSELSRARIYDPSETTSNSISSSVAHQADHWLNPFSDALDLYGNTGGSVASNTYTVPMRNSDGMYLDNDDNELYVIVRYKGNPAPLDDITLTFS